MALPESNTEEYKIYKYNKLALFIALFITWYCFSGYNDVFFLVCGLVSCAISVYFVIKMQSIDKELSFIYLKPLTLKYILWCLWLFKEIILSAVAVSIKVWQTDMKISPVLSWIDASEQTGVGLAVYANAITLTPGTVCIDVKDHKMLVHSLVKENLQDLKSGNMDSKIKKVIEG